MKLLIMQSSPVSHYFLHFRSKYSPQHPFLKHPQFCMSRDSSVGMRQATGWTIGVLGFDSRRGLGIFLFTTASRMALGPTQPPIQGVQGDLSLGEKRPGREADHSPPSIAEVKE
jgi:hypothetical protein